jgi:hypothetical protein
MVVLRVSSRRRYRIFEGFDSADPVPDDPNSTVQQGWLRGTFGKLLVEHAALRVAAKEDVATALRASDHGQLADELTRHLPLARALLDRLDELARGVEAMGLAASAPFVTTVGKLAEAVRDDLGSEVDDLLPKIADALGPHRSGLRSAKYIGSHSPTHPGPDQQWYDTVGPLARIHACYDRLRSYPTAQSWPMADTQLAQRYDDGL